MRFGWSLENRYRAIRYDRKARFFLLSFIVGSGLFSCVMLCRADDWPTFRQNAERSAVGILSNVGTLSEAWAVILDTESVDGSPAVVNGRIYIGTAGGRFFCINASDGNVIWFINLPGALTSSPAVTTDRVFVGCGDRCMYALNADTGAILWSVPTRDAVIASPLLMDDDVLFGSMDGGFRCLDMATGSIRWQTHEVAPISASAAGTNGVVYYGDEDGHVIARSQATGGLLWSTKLSGSVIASPAVYGDKLFLPLMSDTALTPPETNCLTVFNCATGEILWTFRGQSSVLHTPVADTDTVYFATVSGYLSDTEMVACRLTDGRQKWRLRLNGVVDSSPALAGPWLLFGCHDGSLNIIDRARGRLVQSINIGALIFSSPAIVDEAVYFGAQDGKLHCLR